MAENNSSKQVVTWEQLLVSLNSANSNPDNAAWDTYRYMQANVGEGMTSEQARTLLLIYMKMKVKRPSLIHSLMLGVAVRMSEAYADFRLPAFLKMWGAENLRDEDKRPSAGKDGKTYSSLLEKLSKAYMRYTLHHPNETADDRFHKLIVEEAARLGFREPRPMVAVKVFETAQGSRKLRSVKLIGSNGDEMLADSHLFNCPPWEITGKLYDVLPRESKNENVRVEHVAQSMQKIEDVFGTEIGFVDRYDATHQQYHVYDNQSRHFVAERPCVRPIVGGYVTFCPIIPAVDKFKSAIVISVADKYSARTQFGAQAATVAFVNKEKGYLKYVTENKEEGFCNLDKCPVEVKGGDVIHIVTFLRRGKDGEKRKYVAEVY